MSKFKDICAKILKFFSCVPGDVWIHIVTLLLVFTIGGVIIAMFSNPEFAQVLFGLVLLLALFGFILYLAYHLYLMIFDLICEFVEKWID